MTKKQEQEINNIIKSIGATAVDSMPWEIILTTYQQASKELGHSPALAAVYALGARQKDATA